MTTPHLSGQPGDFAEVVLLPGDPLRAKHIAERFFDNPKQVNAVRNALGYTGTYRGRRVSALGSGMGIPSISIYATELITQFGVKSVIRVGSCGGVHPDLKLRDVIVAMSASTDSKVNRIRFMDHDFAATADFDLVRSAVEAAEALKKPIRVGNIFSTDLFYTPQEQLLGLMEKMGILAVEMEAAGLYGLAAEFGAKALTILAVSDMIRTKEHLSPDERQTSFDAMIEIALEVAYKHSSPLAGATRVWGEPNGHLGFNQSEQNLDD